MLTKVVQPLKRQDLFMEGLVRGLLVLQTPSITLLGDKNGGKEE